MRERDFKILFGFSFVSLLLKKKQQISFWKVQIISTFVYLIEYIYTIPGKNYGISKL